MRNDLLYRSRGGAAVVLSLCFLCAPSAQAAPVTIDFAGNFGFTDFEYLSFPRDQDPLAWAFDDAMRAIGAVTSTPGQYAQGPFHFSLQFDTGVADTDGSADFGLFPGAASGTLWLGSASYSFMSDVYTARGGVLGIVPFSVSGPNLSAGGFTFVPGVPTFHFAGLAAASDALDFSTAASWQATLLMGFNGSQHTFGGVSQVTRISVPEPSTLLTLAGAVAVGILRRMRGDHRPKART